MTNKLKENIAKCPKCNLFALIFQHIQRSGHQGNSFEKLTCPGGCGRTTAIYLPNEEAFSLWNRLK